MKNPNFFRVVDEVGRLSLTNHAVAFCLLTYLLNQTWVTAFGLLIAFAAYETKRFFTNPASDLAALEGKVATLAADVEETKGKMNAVYMKQIGTQWKPRA